MTISFDNQTALVCGGSDGIGLATAQQLAAARCKVFLLARNKEKLEKALSTLSHPELQHDYLVANFENIEEVDAVVSAFAKANSPQIIINNTGGPPPGWLHQTDLEALERGFTMHVKCSQVILQHCLPGMKKSKYGRVVNIISTSVKEPIPYLGVSNVVRGAMANWSKTMAMELGMHGITVNNVLPGFTATDRLDDIIKGKAARDNHSTEQAAQLLKSYVPLGRFAHPEEVAQAITFLTSKKAGYITGANLPVDGGRTKSA
jgi:3-oxoacyl-[acyl-carrier protein] reductase